MSNKAKKGSTRFRFKSGYYNIGAIQAELDHEYLRNCFIETGDIEAALDVHSPCSLVAGRTGVGKTALLWHIKENQENVIEVEPENLSFDYIASSNILQFFDEAGLNLDVLFRVLWRHVLVVELLRYKFDIENESGMDKFKAVLPSITKKDRSKEKAIDYLKTWGDSFWKETEYRIQEVVSTIERELEGSIGGSLSGTSLSAKGAKSLTDSQREEVVTRGKEAVAKVQLKELGDVLQVLNEDIFTDKKRNYYILLDRLDENWAEENIRYRLIRALIEELRTFRKIENLKILIAIRTDLLETVFERTRDPGFQEEKFRDLIMPINWTGEQLYELVRERINYLLRHKYTTQEVEFEELFPGKVGKSKAFDYILNRTLYRPRDIISYVNTILQNSVGKSSITVDAVKKAEEEYSEDRFRSLIYEWGTEHPYLDEISFILENRPQSFKVGSITKDDIDTAAVNILSNYEGESYLLAKAAQDYCDDKLSGNKFRDQIVDCLYHVGMVGIKKGPTHSVKWSYEDRAIIGKVNFKQESKIFVHPMLWRKFDTRMSDATSGY